MANGSEMRRSGKGLPRGARQAYMKDHFDNGGQRVGYSHEPWREFSRSASRDRSWPTGINAGVFNYSVNLQDAFPVAH
jgi:hypothetical protein